MLFRSWREAHGAARADAAHACQSGGDAFLRWRAAEPCLPEQRLAMLLERAVCLVSCVGIVKVQCFVGIIE
jgi:hypothetical protein